MISVVVTTKNEEEVIENLLKSLKKQNSIDPRSKSGTGFEIIIVDNNSTDNTKKISKKYTKSVYNFGPERSSQRNFGVKKSTGEYVLILDADMELTKNVLSSCAQKLKKDKEIGALVIPEKSFGEGFWAKCKAFERQFYVGDQNIEAARFFKKSLFLKFKGYDKRITGPEDWDLPLRMKKAGVKIGRINDYIFHNERKFSPIKSAKKKFYYALHAREYLKRHPEMVFSQGNLFFRPNFYKNLHKLLEDPLVTLGFLYTRFLEMSAALFGITLSFIRK